MANSIGSAALILTTNATRLYSGLAEAASRSKSIVNRWASGISIDVGSKTFSAITSGINKVGSAVGRVGRTGGMAALGATAAVAAASVAMLFKGIEGIREIVIQGDMAKSLGVSPEFFTGLAGAAGSFGVELGAVFEGMVNLGGKAKEALKGGEIGNSFRQLGIDIQAFDSMGVEKKFKTLVDALNTLQDPAERVRLSMQILGEEAGKKMSPLISKSKEELEKLTSQFAVSAGEMAKMKQADDAIRTLSVTFTALFRQYISIMTPMIELWATRLPAAIEKARPALEKFMTMQVVIYDLLLDAFEGLISAAGELVTSIKDFVKELGVAELNAMSFEDIVKSAFRSGAVAAAYAWDVIKVGAGAVAVAVGLVFREINNGIKSFASLLTLMNKLPDNLKPPGLDGMVSGLKDVTDYLDQSQSMMLMWGAGTFANFGKSADDVIKWFEKKDQKPKPKPPGEFVGPPKPPPEKPAEPLKYSAVGAAVKGSAAALSIESKFRTEQMTDPKIALAQKQLTEQQKATAAIKEVTEAIRANPVQFSIF